MDYCGVIAVTEEVADSLQREVSVFPEEVHGDVAGFGYGLGTAGSSEGLEGGVEVLGDALNDGLGAGW